MRPLRVFLCHASQDKPAVWNLYRYLKQRGVQPWLDQADLLPGQNWEVEIPKALFASDVILVCLSKNSINKEGYVQKEIAFALDKALEKPEGTIFIIPVKLEQCEVPRRVGMYQWVDYFRTDGRRRLLLSLDLRSAELGEDVAPVILEDTRRRKPAPKPVSDAAEREDAEKAAREKAAREAAEKLARQTAEREATEQRVHDKAGQEAKEKAEREELARRQTRITAAPEKAQPSPPAPKGAVSKLLQSILVAIFALGGVILLGLLFWGISALLNNQPVIPPEPGTATLTSPARTPTATHTPPPPTFTPAPGIGSTMISEKDSMILVFVPAGEFTMGSDVSSDAYPIHQVYLDAFWIDQTEVTNAMYAKCVSDGGCEPPLSSSSYSRNSYFGNSEFDDYPVIHVTWNQAKAYCEWAGRRLPTEAQWEKAARGTDGRTYPWGEEISCNNANYYDYYSERYCVGDTSKVHSYESGKSPYGAYDMAGNVWEWVSSLHMDYPYAADDGRENLSASGWRVLRGGAWNSIDYEVSSADRGWNVANTDRSSKIGFRCALSP
jgi:serine/threonine-protein kinase